MLTPSVTAPHDTNLSEATVKRSSTYEVKWSATRSENPGYVYDLIYTQNTLHSRLFSEDI